MVNDAQKIAEKLGMDLKLQHPDPAGHTGEGEKIETRKIRDWIIRKRCKATIILDQK